MFHLIYPYSLSNLRIESLEEGFFEKFPALEDLDIRSNDLSSLGIKVPCENLKMLNCSKNRLKSTEELMLFPNLENIFIAGNDDIQVCVSIKCVSLLKLFCENRF